MKTGRRNGIQVLNVCAIGIPVSRESYICGRAQPRKSQLVLTVDTMNDVVSDVVSDVAVSFPPFPAPLRQSYLWTLPSTSIFRRSFPVQPTLQLPAKAFLRCRLYTPWRYVVYSFVSSVTELVWCLFSWFLMVWCGLTRLWCDLIMRYCGLTWYLGSYTFIFPSLLGTKLNWTKLNFN